MVEGFCRKMERWPVQLLPRLRVDRALAALPVIARATQPKVLAAVIRTLWNGWCTGRRFQKSHHSCMLGCQFGEDSVEHYGRCRHVWEVYARHFPQHAPPEPQDRLTAFLLLSSPARRAAQNRQSLRSFALLAAAAYATHNTWRHQSQLTPAAVKEALHQHLIQLLA